MIANITGLTLKVPDSGAQGAALGAARLAILARGDGSVSDVLFAPRTHKQIEPDPVLTLAYADSLKAFRDAW